ncbi:hypothetical protein [Streptomyces sp. NPDC017949]|uniref:hypothetical protein n=1 Tax=Streptomyces sp. NPDC017949 TaxID=3365020 RepID=UPI0037A0F1F6
MEDDPQKLFPEARLHGLSARLCEDVDALDSYLPPQVDKLATKVAEVLEEPQLAPACPHSLPPLYYAAFSGQKRVMRRLPGLLCAFTGVRIARVLMHAAMYGTDCRGFSAILAALSTWRA